MQGPVSHVLNVSYLKSSTLFLGASGFYHIPQKFSTPIQLKINTVFKFGLALAVIDRIIVGRLALAGMTVLKILKINYIQYQLHYSLHRCEWYFSSC